MARIVRFDSTPAKCATLTANRSRERQMWATTCADTVVSGRVTLKTRVLWARTTSSTSPNHPQPNRTRIG